MIENGNTPIDEVTIYDITSKTIKTITPTTNKLNVSELSRGVYLISVRTNEQTTTKKFIKN